MALPTGLSVTLETRNMDASTEFYDILGFEKTKNTPEYVTYIVTPGQEIRLQYTDNEIKTKSWGEVDIGVENVDSCYERLVSSGFKPESAPATSKLQGGKSFFIRDPDGQEICFSQTSFQSR